MNYTADDGLKLIEHLGLPGLCKEEEKKFKEKWDDHYKAMNEDVVSTTWNIYAQALPFMCGDPEKVAYALSRQRDNLFDKSLKRVNAQEKIKEGTETGLSMSEILETFEAQSY